MARKSRPGRGSSRRRVPALGALEAGEWPAIVVGLGNPGRKYRSTRHNAGFMVVDWLVDSGSVLSRGKGPFGELTLMEAASRRFLVMKPATFMNESGRAVGPVLKSNGLSPERMIVIHDDIDIPLGDVRIKRGGGTGGHRGLVSLVGALGSGGFVRVRIGVGRPPEGLDPAEYVLTGFSSVEREEAQASVEKAARATLDLISGDDVGIS